MQPNPTLDLTREYPRKPTPAEFSSIKALVLDKYGDSDIDNTLVFAVIEGRFVVTYAMSDTPGYVGRIIIIVWPDTSVTMYREASIDLPSFNLVAGDWYECDKDGIPWI